MLNGCRAAARRPFVSRTAMRSCSSFRSFGILARRFSSSGRISFWCTAARRRSHVEGDRNLLSAFLKTGFGHQIGQHDLGRKLRRSFGVDAMSNGPIRSLRLGGRHSLLSGFVRAIRFRLPLARPERYMIATCAEPVPAANSMGRLSSSDPRGRCAGARISSKSMTARSSRKASSFHANSACTRVLIELASTQSIAFDIEKRFVLGGNKADEC